MQARPNPTKPKYKISNFIAPGNPKIQSKSFYPSQNLKVFCICDYYQKSQQRRCSRCSSSYHNCIVSKAKSENWECPQCRSFYMDPVFTINAKLLETHFKTESIFNYENRIYFYFTLSEQQLKMPVQVRGLKDGRDNLFWPMQGQFYLNSPHLNDPIFQLKPLLLNSNRKHRKEEALLLPNEKLRKGENQLVFYIPHLNGQLFRTKYQHEEKGVYFIGIYSINKLSKEELISKTLKTNCSDKKDFLKLLNELASSDITVEKIKMSLECPYTRGRIRIPIRGKYCRHYTCLCLDTLIQTRVGIGSRDWLCPICSLKINQPVIDSYILKILNDGHPGTEIIMNIDGSYEWIAQDDDMESNESEEKKDKTNKEKISPSKQEVRNEQSISKQIISLDDQEPVQNVLPPPLEINIPQQRVERTTREERLEEEREQNKVALRAKRTQKKKFQVVPVHPRKEEFVLKEVKELTFKNISANEFSRRYFQIEYSRKKVSEDLQILFREVL